MHLILILQSSEETVESTTETTEPPARAPERRLIPEEYLGEWWMERLAN